MKELERNNKGISQEERNCWNTEGVLKHNIGINRKQKSDNDENTRNNKETMKE